MGSKGTKQKAVTVCQVEDLSPRVRRIRFTGHRLKGIKWTPGDKIKLKVRGKSRSYTPARIDAESGWMDVVFFLHGNGPASRWAADVSVGDAVKFDKPEKSISRTKKAPDWAMFMGDETTIGLATALLESLPKRTEILGAIELDPADARVLGALGLPLSAAIRQDYYGDALVDWCSRTPLPEGKGVIWISGETVSVRALKRMLEDRVPSCVRIKTKGYWKAKKRAVCVDTQKRLLAAK